MNLTPDTWVASHRRLCTRCEKPKRTQHEVCRACERAAFPGVAILREVMSRTRIPCACGKVAGYVVNFRPVCSACRDTLRATDCSHRKDWREKRGLCRECGKNEAAPKRKHCTDCLLAARERFSNWKGVCVSANPEALSARRIKAAMAARERRAKLKVLGLCSHCPSKAAHGFTRCQPCLNKDRERQRALTPANRSTRRQGTALEELYGGRADMVAPNGDFAAGVDFESLRAMNHAYVSKL